MFASLLNKDNNIDRTLPEQVSYVINVVDSQLHFELSDCDGIILHTSLSTVVAKSMASFCEQSTAFCSVLITCRHRGKLIHREREYDKSGYNNNNKFILSPKIPGSSVDTLYTCRQIIKTNIYMIKLDKWTALILMVCIVDLNKPYCFDLGLDYTNVIRSSVRNL